MKPDERDEHNWIKEAKKGSRQAFDQLVMLYQKSIIALTYQILGDYDKAKDAAQDAFLRAFENISRFKEKSRFSTWLYRIAVNVSLDEERRRKRQKTDPMTGLEIAQKMDKSDNPAQHYEQKQQDKRQHEYVLQAMQGLSKHQRTATVLKYFHEKSFKEISRILNCSESTARTHVFRALQNMRHYFEDNSQYEEM